MAVRYLENSGSKGSKPDYHKELLASLERITTYNPPVHTCSTGWRFSGLYQGPTSIAYLFYRLSKHYPDLEFKQQTLLEWAEAYLQLGNVGKKHDPDPSHCGIANETLAHVALSSVILDDTSLAKHLCKYEPIIDNPGDNGSNEWLYGRAGYLFFLRMCRAHFSTTNPPTAMLLSQTIEKTIKCITEVPLPWTWHGKAYLGAAHGVVGIISQAVLSDPKCVPFFAQILLELLDTQYSTGNFPSSLPSDRDELVQFCHGGPGFILSLRPILQYFDGPEHKQVYAQIQSAILKAQEDTWKRGLLTKDPCLCHGIASNALALDDDFRFDHFLSCMTSEALESNGWLKDAGHTDKFASLFCGEAGRAWVWAVADLGLEKSCIGFSDV